MPQFLRLLLGTASKPSAKNVSPTRFLYASAVLKELKLLLGTASKPSAKNASAVQQEMIIEKDSCRGVLFLYCGQHRFP
ncbi:MAG: hypothetical protein J6Y12_06840, partial [Lachnospiraceae bacterium]|nr:hypothetical protein [Lachnospiraceae bacterium]